MRDGSRPRSRVPDEVVVRAFAARMRQHSAAQASRVEVTWDGTAAEIAALDRSERTGLGALEVFREPVLSLSGGKLLWTYDDDGVHGPSEGVPRQLAEQLRRRPPDRIHVLCFGSWQAFVDVLQRHRALEATTHLVLAAPELDAPLPASLRSLAISGGALGSLQDLAAMVPALESLTFTAGAPGATEVPDNLRLRHLGLWSRPWSHELDRLVAHPVVRGLQTLDVYAVEEARNFPWTTLLRLRDGLSGLQRILVPGHGVEPSVLARFADWPEVIFVGHDRAEALGFDVAMLGFPQAFR